MTGAPDVDAERRRFLVAEAEHVERAAVETDRDHARGDVRRDQRHAVPAGDVEPPEDPAVDLLEGLGVLLLDEGLDRGEEAHHRDPGEDQGRRCPAGSRRAAERVGRRDGDRAAEERDERDQVVRRHGAVPVDDRDRRAEARPRRDPSR